MAKVIKDCMEPITPILMKTNGEPELFEDQMSPLAMLQMIRLFNPNDREMVGVVIVGTRTREVLTCMYVLDVMYDIHQFIYPRICVR